MCSACGAEFVATVAVEGEGEGLRTDSIVAEGTSSSDVYYRDGRSEIAVLVHEMESAGLDGAEEAASEPKWWARRPSPAAVLVLVVVLAVAGWGAVRWANQSSLDRRIAEDANRIAQRIEGYRSETNLYPDAATWQRWVTGDGAASLLDPWQRPYLYGVDSRAFSISTHGADGRPGGWGEDEDLTFVFRYVTSRMALPRSDPTAEPPAR